MLALAAGLGVPRPAPAAPALTVAVVRSSRLGPFEQATEAAIAALRRSPRQPEVLVFDLDAGEGEAASVLASLSRASPACIVTVGTLATKVVLGAAPIAPVVFAMVLYPEQNGFLRRPGHRVTGASLDVPFDVQFGFVRRLLPQAKRVGVLFHPDETGTVVEAALAPAARHGFTLVPKKVGGPGDVLQNADAILGEVDALWAVADSRVFTQATTGSIVLASLRHHVPMIGLASAQVRAGALAAFTCDYAEGGEQAAALALQILAGDGTPPVTTPTRIGVVVNFKSADHLGTTIPADLPLADESVR